MLQTANIYQRQRHAGIARCINCRNAAINVVVCRAVSQQAAAADGHQPFVSYFSLAHLFSHKDINAPKLDYHGSL